MGSDEQLNWDQVLRRLQVDRSDEAAWGALFDLAWPIAVAVATRGLGRVNSQIEDFAQEAFYRLVKYCRFERLADGKVLRSYLKETVQNVARDVRKSAVRLSLEAEIDPEDLADEKAVTADLAAVASELLHRGEIRQLDKVDRKIVEGLAAGQSRIELQDVTGLNYSALSVRIYRIRKSLHNLLTG